MFEGYLDEKPMKAGKIPWYAVKPELPTLISGLDQTKLALGIDTSHWNGPLTEALIIGADYVQPKATDGYQVQKGNWGDLGTFTDDQFHNTVSLCYKLKKPCIPYHFFQWDYSSDQWNIDRIVKHQYDVICNAFKSLTPKVSYHGFAIDLETPGDTDTNYRDKVKLLYEMLKANPKFSDVPVLFYSSNYYLNKWPALRDYLSYQGANKLLWMAQWMYTKAWVGGWSDFKTQVLPTIEMKVTTPGYANWAQVQWSASCRIEGFTVDVNSWCRTKADLYAWLGFKTDTPPEPPEPPEPTGDYVTHTEFQTLLTQYASHTHGKPA